MAVAQESMTQKGMWKESMKPPLARAMVMTPMVFWASFSPCERAMELAERIWKILKNRLTFVGRVWRKSHMMATMRK